MKTKHAGSPVLMQKHREERMNELKRFCSDPKYQEALCTVKRKISMGKMLHEIRYDLDVTDRFWENLIDMLGFMTFTPQTIMLHHFIRTQTRYEQANELLEEAKKGRAVLGKDGETHIIDDRDTWAKMVVFMAKLDESQIQIAQSLGIISSGQVIDADTLDKYDGMTNEELRREFRKLEEVGEGKAQASSEIIDIESIRVQQDAATKWVTDSVGHDAVDDNDSEG